MTTESGGRQTGHKRRRRKGEREVQMLEDSHWEREKDGKRAITK